MRYALGDFFARSPVLVYPLIALALFALVFTAVLVKTLRKSERQYHEVASLPLEDDEGEVERHG